ncbi:MAG: radical SAM protein [Pseudomonadota bacterium]
MKKHSRRIFVKFGLCLSLTGLVPAGIIACGGCRRKKQASPASACLQGDNADKLRSFVKKDVSGVDVEPVYMKLHRSGELEKRGKELWDIMKSCELCPRRCGAKRLDGDEGFCGSTSQLEVSSHNPHFGEEKGLVGKGGSGAIFLTNCGLRCVFCINWEISQGGHGKDRSIEAMAGMMLDLQERGCHNINMVTPTHYSAHILLALDIAAGKGLKLPLVYNTCGWERLEILEKLDGVVDIYMPDYKYADGKMAARYSSDAESYPEVTKKALIEMNRQVGVAKAAADGLIHSGLIIRHLVMPNGVCGGAQIMKWISENLPKDTYVNIMSQYSPMYKASEFPEISRKITFREYNEVVKAAKEAGLTNMDIQGYPLGRK